MLSKSTTSVASANLPQSKLRRWKQAKKHGALVALSGRRCSPRHRHLRRIRDCLLLWQAGYDSLKAAGRRWLASTVAKKPFDDEYFCG